jgi:ribosomal protein S18 acetylase RimI-like enzyme
MCPMRFESVTESDKEYFRALNRACYEDVVSQQFGHWDDEHQNHSFEMKWSENNFRKIYVDDALVGGVWIDDNPEFIQLREIQIHPTYQGRGIGIAVVKLEIENSRNAGKPIRLRVLFMNKAIALYKRLGFVVIDKNEHQYIMECT